MFYYLQIAKNIAHGYGATFDKITNTNGFHPLYMFLLTVYYKLFPFLENYDIQIVLSFLAIIQLVTGYMIFCILKKIISNKLIMFIAVLFFLFHPFIFFTGLSGVESPIALLFIALSLNYYLSFRSKQSVSKKQFVVLGIFIGLAFLSRTDSSFFVTGILVDFIFHRIFTKKSVLKSEIKNLFFILCASFVTVSPWFLWNIIQFGTISQDSMKALFFWSSHSFKENNPILKTGYDFLGNFKNMTRYLYMTIFNYNIYVLLSLIFITIYRLFIFFKQKTNKVISPLLYPLIMTTALLVFYFFALRHWQTWYMLSTMFILTLVVGVIVERVIVDLSDKFKTPATILILLLLVIFFTSYNNAFINEGFYPWQKQYLKMAVRIPLKVPPGSRIGSFNSGIISKFSKRQVINLDGVTNHEILPYLKSGQIMKYLKHRDIKYIVDRFDFCKIFDRYNPELLLKIEEPHSNGLYLIKID